MASCCIWFLCSCFDAEKDNRKTTNNTCCCCPKKSIENHHYFSFSPDILWPLSWMNYVSVSSVCLLPPAARICPCCDKTKSKRD